MKRPLDKLVFLLFLALSSGEPTPVVIWHGMGDTYNSPTVGVLKEAMEKEIPGIYVHSVQIGNNPIEDFQDGYFGNVNEQVSKACKQLASDERLQNGYHAIGISQGCQFLRAVAQRCPEPRMKNFISIGGQHQGVFGFPRCKNSVLCEVVRHLINHGAYRKVVQNRVVQAQYWHDPLNETLYKEKSIFLADINNEKVNNETYKKNLLRLKNFVMMKFANDSMVIPPESSWFGFFEPGQDKIVVPLQNTSLFIEDRLGLRALLASGRLHFIEQPGGHVELPIKDFIDKIVKKYIVPQ